MKRIFFFATPRDIVPVLRRTVARERLKFVEGGNRADPNFPIYLEPDDIPEPGVSTHETGNASRNYLVSPQAAVQKVEAFIDDAGERRWRLFNGLNEDSVDLVLAGLWKEMLLPGIMSTLHNSAEAQRIMRAFHSALRSEGFVKLDLWWLGQEAFEMLKAGKRLSKTAEQSPPEFDLRLPTS